MTIRVMSPQLANQIAAGEVVDRPASVIKELVENSIDAKATHIKISVEKAGSQYIKIADNGHGMDKESLSLAILRHATSKIETIEDLYAVQTMGFRGEALASITSVARVKMSSRTADADLGCSLQIDGGEIVGEPLQDAMPRGTSIEVMDLFFNTPARKRFLRRETTEGIHIEDTIRKLACAHPEITFEYIKNGKPAKTYHASKPDSQNDRLKVIFGPQIAMHLHYITHSALGMRLQGYIGAPVCTRSQADCQYFVVNGRVVKDTMLSHALKRAYSGLTYQDRAPVCMLSLTIDPEKIDVNVHPTKERIKFEQGQLVSDFLAKSVKASLAEMSVVPESNESVADVTVLDVHKKPTEPMPSQEAFSIERIMSQMASMPARSSPVYQAPKPVATTKPSSLVSEPVAVAEPPEKREYVHHSSAKPQTLGKAICQLHGIYVIALSSAGLIIVDMHAAHERILLSQLESSYSQKNEVATQELLLPQPVKLSPGDSDILKMYQGVLESLGLSWKALSEQQIILSSIPQSLGMQHLDILMNDVISELKKYDQTSAVDDIRHGLFASMACHTAVRANRQLTITEMDHLLREIEQCPHAMVCNHGRPTVVQLTLKDLDAMFHRGQ